MAALIGPSADDEVAVNTLFLLAPTVGLDFACCIAQVYEETATDTGALSSVRYLRDKNFAGIGIPADSTIQPFPINDYQEAAKIYLACLNRLVDGTVAESWYDTINADARAWIDGHWAAHCAGAKRAGVTVKTVDDLNIRYVDPQDKTKDPQATWAWDADYQDLLEQWGRKVFPNLPNTGGANVTPTPPPASDYTMTKGLIPLPSGIEVRLIPDSQTNAWDDLGQRVTRGIVLHRMLGELWGTDSYFRQVPNTPGLTDYGIDANTGEILQWNDPTGAPHPGISPNRAGWASGPLSNPYGDGLAFYQQYGINAINRDLVSLEISGYENDPVAPAVMQKIAQFLAHFAHDLGIHWDDFPIGKDGYSIIYWHQEFTIGTGKACPFAWVMNNTSNLIGLTRDIMKAAQTKGQPVTPPTPVYVKPEPVPGPVVNQVYHGTQLFVLPDTLRQMRTNKNNVKVLVAAAQGAKQTHEPLAKDVVVNLNYQCWSKTDLLPYAIGPDGGRILLSDLEPIPPTPDPAPSPAKPAPSAPPAISKAKATAKKAS